MSHGRHRGGARRGFTLIELLVALSVIALVLAIALPAVFRVRESSRKIECQNHLRQIGVAVLSHHDAHQQFPTNGWGYQWVGDPDRGSRANQPGGWIYNILPFVEQQALYNQGAEQPADQKRLAATERMRHALPLFHCPSRRSAVTYPYTLASEPYNASKTDAAKSDYAINGGDTRIDAGRGPEATDRKTLSQYEWPSLKAFTGIAFVRSQVSHRHVRDGAGTTYLVGEKYVPRNETETGMSAGDDQSMYMGDDADIRRWTDTVPWPDWKNEEDRWRFGSAHKEGCFFVMCDGAVKFINYQIDAETHRRLGNRDDGMTVDVTGL